MIWTLKICFSMSLGLCSSIQNFTYPTETLCQEMRVMALKNNHIRWAVCSSAPKEVMKS